MTDETARQWTVWSVLAISHSQRQLILCRAIDAARVGVDVHDLHLRYCPTRDSIQGVRWWLRNIGPEPLISLLIHPDTHLAKAVDQAR